MRRRDFIKGIAGSAASWPFAARAQQPDGVRRIGVLTGNPDDAIMRTRHALFVQSLQQLGWTDGGNVRIDYRWGGGNAELIRKYATELASLAPDVILATGGVATAALLQATRSIPIVFTIVPDPVVSGFVDSLSRPGRNATGMMQFEYSLCGKWAELLKEIAPGVARAAVLWDPSLPSSIGQYAVIQALAPSLHLEIFPVAVREPAQIERAVATFSAQPNGGLIVTGSAQAVTHRRLIVALAAKYKLPAVYNARDYVVNDGLVSYAADFLDQYRRAAGYVDRILKGEKPADLPVQAPTKYELVVNLKTAKALGLTIPTAVLARADEVIE